MPHPRQLADLIASIERSPIAFLITDPRLPDNPIVAANSAFSRLTLYPLAEIVGRNCRFLQGPGSDPAARAAIAAAIAAARPATVPILNYRRDGGAFCNAVMVAPVRDESGAVAWFLGSQAEIEEEPAFAARRAIARARLAALPRRQAEVLRAMTAGARNKAIAHALGISERMVKTHRARLLRALDAASAAEAIRLAVEAGL